MLVILALASSLALVSSPAHAAPPEESPGASAPPRAAAPQGASAPAAPAPAPLTLDEARRAPRVEVDLGGDGAVVLDGRMFLPPSGEGGAPALQEALHAALAARPDAVVWLRVPPSLATGKLVAVLDLLAGARGVVIESPGLPPLLPAGREQLPTVGPLPDLATGTVERPPLTLRIDADGAWVGRNVDHGIHTSATGAARLAWLEGVLAADGAVHPGRSLVILDADRNTPVGDVIALGKLVADTGGGAVLLASGPAAGPASGPTSGAGAPPAPPPPRPTGPVERAPGVDLTPEGDLFLRAEDDTLTRIPHAEIDHYEVFCDADVCDLVVATTGGRRIGIGTRPRVVPVGDWLFERRVHTYDGRLGLPATPRSGELSPVVRVPGNEPEGAPAAAAAAPREESAPILGSLLKSEITAVIGRNLKPLRRCWVDARRPPPRRGKVTVKFTIAKDGTVSDARIKSSDYTDEGFHGCLVETFRTFRFPAPQGGGVVIVSYPFVFAP